MATVRTTSYIAFATALAATLTSLYYSEIAGIVPCVLCWYQRIAMYPLVVILAVGIVNREQSVHRYVLPLAAIGWLLALYHSLLQWKVVSEGIVPCVNNIPCATAKVNYLGFITIPSMSLAAFSLIIIAMLIEWRRPHEPRN